MIVETRHRLREWGKWASGSESRLGSMFRTLFGSGGTDSSLMPAHIQEIDVIVCRAIIAERSVLCQVYTRGGSLSDKALVLGIPRSTLVYRLRSAEWYVNSELDALSEMSYKGTRMRFQAPKGILAVRYF